ncbi:MULTISPECIES: potassium channel family protein [unclassified Cryobacterium]|uniref:potassium channel family protein n=1 Tax=unclassified Cryobacterium TaxID=2649013 RepID=UPI0010698E38|nr:MULTISPECIES: potassium channel family protein [unclassified Cryobacterium]TFC50345.1 two pore domain potassium channel family protein [Cryobacterium sp. TMB3-1-2]TFC71920.1 two pore domain potassium channel family protein [Cryobacterium sp. TMB3-15]TFC78513.1 two pore domain potassium channel family protein [Cryobacterium sp. TMB3-10]TFD44570.1 two pore domain potassium channel family protein [Cryobacterium sp. TMB3-12]
MTQERWQKITGIPLTIAAVLFLIAYAWQVIGDLSGPEDAVAEAVITATWAVFVLDYAVNLALAPQRWKWFRAHIFDLLVVVLPLLRPLRLLRLVTLLSVLQRTAGAAFRERVVMYVAGAAALLVFVASLAVLDAERSAEGGTITNFADALWWAFVTITTVGYGDFAPVTALGRLIAGGLMLGGVALLGVVTATLASWIIEQVAKQEEDAQVATRGEIRSLARQVEQLQATLDRKAG